jgi:glycosyltransferase involved in cell wall biosynthesis
VTADSSKKKILIISHDKIGGSMAGPGIRYHYMAEILSGKFDVTVGFYDKTYLPEKEFKHSYKAIHVDAYYFEAGFQGIDIVISHWLTSPMVRYCNLKNIFIVFDFYAPSLIENLANNMYSGKDTKPEDDAGFDHSLEMFHIFLEYGDLFLLSNHRQLDFWTGYAFGARTIHLSNYKDREVYNRFIYAPMGIDTSQDIKQTKKVIRGVIPGISDKDKILLWTGGIWGHFDGQVLIRSMKRLEKSRPDIKLVFFGTQHPNPSVPEMKESLDTRELAKKLSLDNKSVFFLDGWVKYSERINYLLEADAAVNTHKDSIEAEFSHRTRVLDHLLVGLPTLSTSGDYMSDSVIGPSELGIVVPPNDELLLEKAIIDILDPRINARVRKNILNERKRFDWEETLGEFKSILSSNPKKLTVLKNAHVLKQPNFMLRFARKVVPVPIKKLIVRLLRIIGLK